MRVFKTLLLFCWIQQSYARSHGVRRDYICDGVSEGTLVIKDDYESCGTYIACIGPVAQRFKCFNDNLYGNGTSVCLACDENVHEYYEDDAKKVTKKKFTYKPTGRTKPVTSKKYAQPTRPPTTKSHPSQTSTSKTDHFEGKSRCWLYL